MKRRGRPHKEGKHMHLILSQQRYKQLADYCRLNERTKTEVIEMALLLYLNDARTKAVRDAKKEWDNAEKFKG